MLLTADQKINHWPPGAFVFLIVGKPDFLNVYTRFANIFLRVGQASGFVSQAWCKSLNRFSLLQPNGGSTWQVKVLKELKACSSLKGQGDRFHQDLCSDAILSCVVFFSPHSSRQSKFFHKWLGLKFKTKDTVDIPIKPETKKEMV